MQKVLALYCRASQDKRGHSESVGDQETWGRAYGAKNFPELPIEVFVDNDLSAADPNVFRADFERLREWVRGCRVAEIWSVEQYRLSRQPVEWFEFAAELVEADVPRIHTDRDGVILVEDDVAGIKAVLGGGEVKRNLRRLRDRQDEQAAKGWPPGSRPFGYEHARIKGERTYRPIPKMADALNWAGDRVLDGWAKERVAAALRERGFVGAHRRKVKDSDGNFVLDENGDPVTRPTKLTGAAIGRMLTNPTVAGFRVHRGQIVGRGNWEPIIEEGKWLRICAKLKAPRAVNRKDGKTYPVRKINRAGRTARKYELTGGTITCGVCEAQLAGTAKQLRNKKGVRTLPYFVCHPKYDGRACVGINAEHTQEFVAKRLKTELNKPALNAAMSKDDHAELRERLTAELSTLTAQRPELAQAWASGGLTMAEWQVAREALDAREAELRGQLAEVPPPPSGVSPKEIAEAWDEMNLDERREVIAKFVERVTIMPAKPGTTRFDSDRVKIEWKFL